MKENKKQMKKIHEGSLVRRQKQNGLTKSILKNTHSWNKNSQKN